MKNEQITEQGGGRDKNLQRIDELGHAMNRAASSLAALDVALVKVIDNQGGEPMTDDDLEALDGIHYGIKDQITLLKEIFEKYA